MYENLTFVTLLGALVFCCAPASAAETDAVPAIAEAEIYCKAADFNSLFDLIVRIPAARIAFSAETITEETYRGKSGQRTIDRRDIPRAQYNDFPVALIDNEFVYAPTAFLNGEINPNPDRLNLSIDQGQNEGWSVEWTQMKFGSEVSEEGDENDASVEGSEYGNSGNLYFHPTKDCWELSYSQIFEGRAGDELAN